MYAVYSMRWGKNQLKVETNNKKCINKNTKHDIDISQMLHSHKASDSKLFRFQLIFAYGN